MAAHHGDGHGSGFPQGIAPLIHHNAGGGPVLHMAGVRDTEAHLALSVTGFLALVLVAKPISWGFMLLFMGMIDTGLLFLWFIPWCEALLATVFLQISMILSMLPLTTWLMFVIFMVVWLLLEHRLYLFSCRYGVPSSHWSNVCWDNHLHELVWRPTIYTPLQANRRVIYTLIASVADQLVRLSLVCLGYVSSSSLIQGSVYLSSELGNNCLYVISSIFVFSLWFIIFM